MARKKVLLMGKAHSGKTSMRSIIFANYLARETSRLAPTLDVEHHHVRFLGDLTLNLWDCGGQDAFYESYFERDRETIFRSVELLIYVLDIESESPDKDFDHFADVLEALEENSPDARIFVLVHKMDLVAAEERDAIFQDRQELIAEACNECRVTNYTCFATSIWDETLYKAWSEIVTNLIPNIRLLESHLQHLGQLCDADEVVLFERATFLVICHASMRTLPRDAHRFEKISNIVKQFKLSCGKAQAPLEGLQVGNARFTAFIDAFTQNTYLMVIQAPDVSAAATQRNLQAARPQFEKYIPRI